HTSSYGYCISDVCSSDLECGMARCCCSKFQETLREFKLEWFVIQAKCLLEFAATASSHSALIYSALETRNAIEETAFELVATILDRKRVVQGNSSQMRQ